MEDLTSKEALAKRAAKFGNGIDAPSMDELNVHLNFTKQFFSFYNFINIIFYFKFSFFDFVISKIQSSDKRKKRAERFGLPDKELEADKRAKREVQNHIKNKKHFEFKNQN